MGEFLFRNQGQATSGWSCGSVRRIRIILTLILVGFASHLSAEVIRLNGGQVIKGRVVSKTEKVIIIATPQGTFTFALADVLEIAPDGSNQIVQPDKMDGRSPLVQAAMGFIPFYSGLYRTPNDYLGIPFATVNGLSALYVFLQLRPVPISFNDATGYETKRLIQTTGPEFFNIIRPDDMAGTQARMFVIRKASPVFRFVRVPTGETVGLREAQFRQRLVCQYYLIASIMNAGLTYYNLRFQDGGPIFGGSTASRSSETTGGVFAYVVPTPDGAAFAMTSFF